MTISRNLFVHCEALKDLQQHCGASIRIDIPRIGLSLETEFWEVCFRDGRVSIFIPVNTGVRQKCVFAVSLNSSTFMEWVLGQVVENHLVIPKSVVMFLLEESWGVLMLAPKSRHCVRNWSYWDFRLSGPRGRYRRFESVYIAQFLPVCCRNIEVMEMFTCRGSIVQNNGWSVMKSFSILGRSLFPTMLGTWYWGRMLKVVMFMSVMPLLLLWAHETRII